MLSRAKLTPSLISRISLHTPPPPLRFFPARLLSTEAQSTKRLIRFTFVNKDGSKLEIAEPEGTNLLDAAHKNNVDLEGACEASLACSTCHVYIEKPFYNKIPEPTDEENDMLDLAFELKENSRLGCQVKLTPELEGMIVTLPPATRNMAVDGYKAPKH